MVKTGNASAGQEQHTGRRNGRGSRLDRYVTPQAQGLWLESPLAEPELTGPRPRDRAQRERLQEGYERLRADTRFDDLVAALHRYIAWTVPFPRRTERRFWVLAASPSPNRSNFPRWCTLSVNVLDTLVVSCPVAHAGRLAVRLSVDLDEAVAEWGSLDCMARSLPDLLIEEATTTVRPGVLAIEGDHINALPRLLRLPGVARAARLLNLDLMRRGPVPHNAGHCFDLADAVLEAPFVPVDPMAGITTGAFDQAG